MADKENTQEAKTQIKPAAPAGVVEKILFDTTLREGIPLAKHKFLGPLFYALIIDSIDLLPNFLALLTPFLEPINIGIDIVIDIIQTILALVVFKNPWFAITNPDYLLPPPLDILPSYTAKVLMGEFLRAK